MLQVENLCVQYGKRVVLQKVNFTLESGQWLMVAGPNGAGKSTLLGALAQTVPYTGAVSLGGQNAAALRPNAFARKVGMLRQRQGVNYSFTVEEVVHLGRYAHAQGMFAKTAPDDDAMVENALRETGLLGLRGQSVLTLSGGELQRVFLAQLLAQDPAILLLDEPVNHLDLAYQKQIFSLIDAWRQKPGRAVVSVVHDIALARAFGSHALLLHEGQPVAMGGNDDVLTRQRLAEVYGMDVYGWMHGLLQRWQV